MIVLLRVFLQALTQLAAREHRVAPAQRRIVPAHAQIPVTP